MKDIEKLLKRFMDGETSVEEETALTDFFRSATDEDRPANISGRLGNIQDNVPPV